MATFTKRKRKLVLGNLLLLALFITTASAQSVFTPKTSCNDYEYEKLVVETLVGDARLYYMCLPAFTNEYALSLNDSTLVYVHAKDKSGNIWNSEKLRKHGAKAKRKTRRYKLSISEDDCAVLENLFADATQTANFFNESIGIDGVSYNLHYWDKTVKAWSPREGSRTGRVVHALDSLCYAVEHSDRAVLKRQMDTCRVLTKEFAQLHPISYFYPTKSINYTWEKGSTIRFEENGKLDTSHFSRVEKSEWHYSLYASQLIVTIPDFMTKKVNPDSLRDSVAHWNRELYIHHRQCKVNVNLNDTITAMCEVDCNNCNNPRTLHLPAEQLKHDIIFSAAALSDGYYLLSPTGEWQRVQRK